MLLGFQPQGGYAGSHGGALFTVDVGRRWGGVRARGCRIAEAVHRHADAGHDAGAGDSLRGGRVEAAHALAGVDQRVDVDGVESGPRKALCAEGGRDFRRPVVVGGVAGVEGVVEGLHQAVELRAEAVLELSRGVALAFPPFCPTIFEPHLGRRKKIYR